MLIIGSSKILSLEYPAFHKPLHHIQNKRKKRKRQSSQNRKEIMYTIFLMLPFPFHMRVPDAVISSMTRDSSIEAASSKAQPHTRAQKSTSRALKHAAPPSPNCASNPYSCSPLPSRSRLRVPIPGQLDRLQSLQLLDGRLHGLASSLLRS